MLDIKEDESIPLIWGRQFLATGGVVIDVKKGELSLNIKDEHVMFKIYKTMKFHEDEHEEYMRDHIQAPMKEHVETNSKIETKDLEISKSA
ncbi:hypothetical protein ACS0TY_020286 [Phlomoides rotata]